MRTVPWLAILAALGFLCAAILGFAPMTPRGVQCPTATVQTVAIRDCCGRVVFRAPRPGDRAFVQCACAEKKAGTAKAVVGSKVEFVLPPTASVVLVPTLPAFLAAPRFGARFVSVSAAPPVPPPA